MSLDESPNRQYKSQSQGQRIWTHNLCTVVVVVFLFFFFYLSPSSLEKHAVANLEQRLHLLLNHDRLVHCCLLKLLLNNSAAGVYGI